MQVLRGVAIRQLKQKFSGGLYNIAHLRRGIRTLLRLAPESPAGWRPIWTIGPIPPACSRQSKAAETRRCPNLPFVNFSERWSVLTSMLGRIRGRLFLITARNGIYR